MKELWLTLVAFWIERWKIGAWILSGFAVLAAIGLEIEYTRSTSNQTKPPSVVNKSLRIKAKKEDREVISRNLGGGGEVYGTVYYFLTEDGKLHSVNMQTYMRYDRGDDVPRTALDNYPIRFP